MRKLTTPARRMLARARAGVVNRRGLAALRRLADPRAARLAAALERGLRADFTEQERAWVARIEAQRARMESSTELLHTRGSEWSGDPADVDVLTETLAEITALASKGPRSTAVLFRLIRAFRPAVSIELGTCVGVSCAYQAAALTLNGSGTLASFDASGARSAAAGRLLGSVGLADVSLVVGRFQDTLVPALERLGGPLDYAFVDGHHDEHATFDYYEQLLRFAAPDAVVVFDDIHWSDGMERVWERIAADGRAGLCVDLRDMGVCLLGAPRSPVVRLALR